MWTSAHWKIVFYVTDMRAAGVLAYVDGHIIRWRIGGGRRRCSDHLYFAVVARMRGRAKAKEILTGKGSRDIGIGPGKIPKNFKQHLF